MKGVRLGRCAGCGGEKLFTGRPPKCGTCGGRVVPDGLASKYHNRKATAGGEVFDSQREALRWNELLLLLAAGKISVLRRQVPYELHEPGGAVVCRYVADFVYREDGREVVEDAKGMKTREYRLKRKWMLLEYGIRIVES